MTVIVTAGSVPIASSIDSNDHVLMEVDGATKRVPTSLFTPGASISNYTSRSGFVAAVAAGLTVASGTHVFAAGVGYIYDGTNYIPDLPGFAPALLPAPISAWENSNAGIQAAFDWSHANSGAPIALDVTISPTTNIFYGNLTLVDAGGKIDITVDSNFTTKTLTGGGPWCKDVVFLPRSSSSQTLYPGEDKDTRVEVRVGSKEHPIKIEFDKTYEADGDDAVPSFPWRLANIDGITYCTDESGTSTNPTCYRYVATGGQTQFSGVDADGKTMTFASTSDVSSVVINGFEVSSLTDNANLYSLDAANNRLTLDGTTFPSGATAGWEVLIMVGVFEHAPTDIYGNVRNGLISIKSNYNNKLADRGGLWIRDIIGVSEGPDYGVYDIDLDIDAVDWTGDETVAIFNTHDASPPTHAGDGVTVTFSADGAIYFYSHVTVTVDDVLVDPADYTYTTNGGSDTVTFDTAPASGVTIRIGIGNLGYFERISGTVRATSNRGLAFGVINNALAPFSTFSGHLDVFCRSVKMATPNGVFQSDDASFSFGRVTVEVDEWWQDTTTFGKMASLKEAGKIGYPRTNRPTHIDALYLHCNDTDTGANNRFIMCSGDVDVDYIHTSTDGALPSWTCSDNWQGSFKSGLIIRGASGAVRSSRDISGDCDIYGCIQDCKVSSPSVRIFCDTDVWPSLDFVWRMSTTEHADDDLRQYEFRGTVYVEGAQTLTRVLLIEKADVGTVLDYTLNISDYSGGPISRLQLGGSSPEPALHKRIEINGTATAQFESRGGVVVMEEGTWTPALSFNNGVTGITYSEQTGKWRITGGVLHMDVVVVLTSKGTDTGSLGISLPSNFSGTEDFVVTSGFGALYNYSNCASVTSPTVRIDNVSSTPRLRIYNQTAAAMGQWSDANVTNTSQIRIGGAFILG